MSYYKVFKEIAFVEGDFAIVPIRSQDRYLIMQWRNDQIYLLRQNQLLTEADQDKYFETVISNSFNNTEPSQVLFSFLQSEQCVGYGGLVHIDWTNRNAEISFLLKTDLNFERPYHKLFSIFLDLVIRPAERMNLHRIFTFGYDVHQYRFLPLIESGFLLDATLRGHVFISGQWYNVKIYSKILD